MVADKTQVRTVGVCGILTWCFSCLPKLSLHRGPAKVGYTMKTNSFCATLEGGSLDLEEEVKYLPGSVVGESENL